MAAAVPLVTKDEYGPAETAVSLSLAIIKKSKANSWAEFMQMAQRGDIAAVEAVQSFIVSDQQLALLEEYQHFINLVQVAPPITPSFCSGCHTVSLQSKGSTKKCINTRGCTGSLVKPTAASRGKAGSA